MQCANQKFLGSYNISQTWDGDLLPPSSAINIKLSWDNDEHSSEGHLHMDVDAPYYGDPLVPGEIPPGSTPELWEYEVVEIFFLGEDSRYLEVELSPKGHYLILQLDGKRNIVKQGLPLDEYVTSFHNDKEQKKRWRGKAVIPQKYFPSKVCSMNAYAIHGSGKERVYMSLYPANKLDGHVTPDFHRLEYFQPFSIL